MLFNVVGCCSAFHVNSGLWYINEVTETCTFEDGPELTQATNMINSTPEQAYDPLLNIEKNG